MDDMDPRPVAIGLQEAAVVLRDRDRELRVRELPGQHALVDVQVVCVRGEAVPRAGQPAAEPGGQRGVCGVVRVHMIDGPAAQAARVRRRERHGREGAREDSGAPDMLARYDADACSEPQRPTEGPPAERQERFGRVRAYEPV